MWARRRGFEIARVAVCLLASGSSALAEVDPVPSSDRPAAPQAWIDQVQEGIAAQEYQITKQARESLAVPDGAWQAPNRAHNLRTTFTETGIRVVPRQEIASPWAWGLSLVGYGRGGVRWPVPAATLSPSGNRMSAVRGGIEEWYVNDTRGLEQGFELAASPEDVAASSGASPVAGRVASPLSRTSFSADGDGRTVDPGDLLYLDMQLTGDLRPVVAADGQAIDFEAPGGARVLRYAELKVTDATGRRLDAWMEGVADERVQGVRIVVNAAGGVYPISVDPLATSPAWTAESDQAGAGFGVSVATAGDVNGDGYSDVIVGADAYDNGQSNEGRAYVYLGSASGLAATAAWTAESNQASASFGESVATAGDVNGDGYSDVIVGAETYDNLESNEGRAFVFLGSASGLAATAAWTAESDQTSANFGVSVATAGDVNGDGYSDVIVGANLYDNGQADEGRAYVYLGSASGLAATAAWTAESNQKSANFGVSVATAGDVNGDGYSDVIVGASYYDNGHTEEGRVLVYLGSASGLAATAAWTAESNQASSIFGISVATAGDVNGDGYSDVIVGAPNYNYGETDEGKAFVYLGSTSGLAGTAAWTAEGDQDSAEFGSSVATAGDINGDGFSDVIVGAYPFDNGQTDEGRAYVYLGSTSGLAATPTWTAESGQAGAFFGLSVATAGDVNGDGYSDVIVGADSYDNGETHEGRAFVYLGSASGLAGTTAWTVESDQVDAEFALSVATAGDVNGDGYSDVIVGARLYDFGQADEGRAFVYLGSASGLALSAAWTAESDQASAQFGVWVATAGDVNGDGYADVIVGARYYDGGQTDEGRAYVYLGSASGLALSAAWTAESDQASAHFGHAVATAGDVNGDGYSDVIVGARLYDFGQTDEGRAFVYLGSSSGLELIADWTAESNQVDAEFGFSVATAGDVNGDGYSDVIVGAPFHDNGQTDEGLAFVYLGSASGLAATAAWTAESNQASAEFGFSLATAGDVNGDGYSDVIVGAYLYDTGQNNGGRANVYLGSASGLAATPAWTEESDQGGPAFGYAVATAGDVNGDGYSDVLVGARTYDNGQANEGRAYVYLGSASGLAATTDWTAESGQAGAEFGVSVETAGDVNGDGYSDVIVGARLYDNGHADEGRAYVYYGNARGGLSLNPRQRRASDAAPIAHLGSSDSPDSFRLNLLGRTPFGRGRARLEWEVKPLGTLFTGTGTAVGSLGDTGVSGAPLSELAAGLFDDTPYHWRVRLRYDPASTPFAPHSRWLTMPWKGWQQAMLRTKADACLSGGNPVVCDDANVCTTDTCDSATGCVFTNNTASCNDANACTTADTCAAGSCVGGSAPNCNDGSVCTDDSCDPAFGCVNANNTASCDDGNACTTADTCAAGSCSGTAGAVPGEVASVLTSNSGPTITFGWSPTAGASGYDMLRGKVRNWPVGSNPATETCLSGNVVGSTASDGAVPAAGEGYWYLFRAENACGNGSYGAQGVHGVPTTTRLSGTCP